MVSVRTQAGISVIMFFGKTLDFHSVSLHQAMSVRKIMIIITVFSEGIYLRGSERCTCDRRVSHFGGVAAGSAFYALCYRNLCTILNVKLMCFQLFYLYYLLKC